MLKTKKEEYSKMVKAASMPSPKLRDFIFAFISGGFVCVIGQLLFEAFTGFGFAEVDARGLVCVSLIFIAAVLTSIGVFDDIARVCGAGVLVPITGFSNAVVSPAIEFKNEGFVLGVGAKMFTIAGPVIVYGTVASVIYGVIYWVTTLF